ncbi:MAG: ABC transporter ATP-binding protein [Thermomicrobiales bacterium]|nr:ABC transporter ATP-binding protein [Thermomicrobiales bacterium]
MMTPILSLNQVRRDYGDGAARITALHNATFEVYAGELIALVGPSGSGKSTLLSIAGALLQPSSGEVRLAGDTIGNLDNAARTRLRLERIGFIFQASNLISFLTGREQVQWIGKLLGLPDDEANQRGDRLLEELGMTRRANHYPQEMSGGERQRIAIARALMNEPELILADEPTASLDGARGRQVVELLATEVHSRNTAGILVTHDERLIDVCDRVLRIADGQVIEI